MSQSANLSTLLETEVIGEDKMKNIESVKYIININKDMKKQFKQEKM